MAEAVPSGDFRILQVNLKVFGYCQIQRILEAHVVVLCLDAVRHVKTTNNYNSCVLAFQIQDFFSPRGVVWISWNAGILHLNMPRCVKLCNYMVPHGSTLPRAQQNLR